MGYIPKPSYCGQKWLEMEKAEGGRICGACTKLIVDFSKMTWSEIEALQLANNNSVCGMYHPKQLEYWGREIPSKKAQLKKYIGLSSLTITMAANALGQSTPIDHVLIQGQVVDGQSKKPLEYASVRLKQSKIEAITDSNGMFQLVLKELPEKNKRDTLEIFLVGYQSSITIFNDLNAFIQSDSLYQLKGVVELPIKSISDLEISTTAFYVEEPSTPELAKWKFEQLFKGKKKKGNKK